MIIILAGGTSAERSVSLTTAQSIAESLKRQQIEFAQVDTADTTWLKQVTTAKPKAVIIALHGPGGEDGSVQKILEKNKIPYTGSDAAASLAAINKILTKDILRKDSKLSLPQDFSETSVAYPAVVKPNKQGSSYGVSIVRNQAELSQAIKLAQQYDQDQEYIIEEQIQGTELACGVIDVFGQVEALPLVEIIPKSELFDFEAKYTTESGCEEICPARISAEITTQIQKDSVRLFKQLRIRQYCRIDWILRDTTPYFLEINTLPGMTPTSLINKELAASGIDFDLFIKHLLETAK